MGVGFQIKIFLSLFGESRKFNVMLQAVTGNVHDVVALGDIIVMVSDGITEADKEDDEARWLQEILRQIRTGRESAETIVPRRLARKILEEAQQRCGCREHDDLTVLVALVESTR